MQVRAGEKHDPVACRVFGAAMWLVNPDGDCIFPPTSFEKGSPKVSPSQAHTRGNVGEDLRWTGLSA